jgi:thiol-disulfide isomerase/thioredoxin
MGKIVCILVIVLSPVVSYGQIPLVRYNSLEEEFTSSDKLTVVNFWATWCGPCIKELPHFEAASKREDLNVILVSLDFPNQQEKVKQFVEKRNLTAKVVLLNETDYDNYMPKVSQNWSGAIPTSLFIDTYGDRYFYEKAFTEETLNQTISKHLN